MLQARGLDALLPHGRQVSKQLAQQLAAPQWGEGVASRGAGSGVRRGDSSRQVMGQPGLHCVHTGACPASSSTRPLNPQATAAAATSQPPQRACRSWSRCAACRRGGCRTRWAPPHLPGTWPPGGRGGGAERTGGFQRSGDGAINCGVLELQLQLPYRLLLKLTQPLRVGVMPQHPTPPHPSPRRPTLYTGLRSRPRCWLWMVSYLAAS